MKIGSSLALLAVVAAVATLAWQTVASAADEGEARFVPLETGPGRTAAVVLDGVRFSIEVPSGPEQGASLGTLRVTSTAASFDSGPLARNGSIEGLWIADLDDDDSQDAVLVVRSAGSGSYVELFLLTRTARAWGLQQLPEPDPALLAGTMGHDAIAVAGGQLLRTLPTYAATPGLRIDRQWQPADALEGQLPLKSDADANASPSGGDLRLVYDLAAGAWRRAD